MLAQFMKQLSNEFELEKPIETQVPGTYTIGLEEDLSVDVSETSQGIHIHSTLGPCPRGKEEEFLVQAMLGNLFGQGTKGSVLALNEEGNELKLTRLIDYSVNYKELKDILEDFINSVDFWREETLNYK